MNGMRLSLLLVATLGIFISGAAAKNLPAGWKTYSDTKLGYSISYPPHWRVITDHVYPGFGPDHPIPGVAFEIPQPLTKGTNLSSNLTRLSVESVPFVAGKRCDVARFIPDPRNVRLLHENGMAWIAGDTDDAGAGNLYEITAFALPNSKPCLAVRYFVHSTNIGNYDSGTVKAFDRKELLMMFDAIRRTLQTRP